jgi:hypothetical protein
MKEEGGVGDGEKGVESGWWWAGIVVWVRQ